MKASTRLLLLCAAVLVTVAAVQPLAAQSIPVTTPRLPPHTGAPGAAAAPAQTGHAAYGPAQGQVQGQQAQQGQQGQQGHHAHHAQHAQHGQQGQFQAAYAPAPAAPVVIPQRAQAGLCRAEPTPDRQTLLLVSGTPALPRAQVPLGEFRAQQVVHSPDGRWAVAFTKLRGAAQYAAMSIDLESCEVRRVVDLRAAGEDVRFDGDHAVLRMTTGEQRIGLRDGSVR